MFLYCLTLLGSSDCFSSSVTMTCGFTLKLRSRRTRLVLSISRPGSLANMSALSCYCLSVLRPLTWSTFSKVSTLGLPVTCRELSNVSRLLGSSEKTEFFVMASTGQASRTRVSPSTLECFLEYLPLLPVILRLDLGAPIALTNGYVLRLLASLILLKSRGEKTPRISLSPMVFLGN